MKTSYKSDIAKFYMQIAATIANQDEAQVLRLYHAALKYDTSLKTQIAQSFFTKASNLSLSGRVTEPSMTYLKYSIEFDGEFREKVADFAYETSQQYVEKGFLSEAIQYAQFSKELDTKHLQDIGKLLYEIGIKFAEQGNKDRFIGIFTEAKAIVPDYQREDERFVWWVGEYYYLLGEVDIAKTYYEKFLKQYPNASVASKAKSALDELKMRENGLIGVFNVNELQSNHPEVIKGKEGFIIKATYTGGFLCYGQYVKNYPVKPLDVYFSIYIDNNSADNREIITLDVYDSSVDRLLAQQTFSRKQFPKAPGFNLFKLSFIPSEDSILEFRIYYICCAHVIADKIVVVDPTKMTVKNHADIEKLGLIRH